MRNPGFEFDLAPAEAEQVTFDDMIVLPTLAQQDAYWAVEGERRWPHFQPVELRCKGSGGLVINFRAMDALQRLRWSYGGPIPLNSAFRCRAYNEAVGGSPRSLHMHGMAFDTPMLNGNAPGLVKLVHLATKAGFTGFGVYEKFTHIDIGPMRFW